MFKRLFDVCFSLAGLSVTAPVFLLVWVVIKLEDRGPVFYRQTRVGQGGRLFQILKFRTMTPNADKMGPSITASGDPRVTRVGRFLRKTKFDELPQLWNVLCGEMSIVGPRPEVPKYVALYSLEQKHVLSLKPGITDDASIAFRDEENMLAKAENPEMFYISYCIPRKIELNLCYAKRATVLRDFFVVVRTVCSVWGRH